MTLNELREIAEQACYDEETAKMDRYFFDSIKDAYDVGYAEGQTELARKILKGLESGQEYKLDVRGESVGSAPAHSRSGEE